MINQNFFKCFLNGFQCKFFNSDFSFDQIFAPLYEIEFWTLVFDILVKKHKVRYLSCMVGVNFCNFF